MRSDLDAAWIMPVLYLIAVVYAHGGNDKSPFLVIAVAMMSFIVSLFYFIAAFSKRQKKKNLQKAVICILPFLVTSIIFTLARAGLVDTLLILGFK